MQSVYQISMKIIIWRNLQANLAVKYLILSLKSEKL